jgi:AcrR family transcriptional regulator
MNATQAPSIQPITPLAGQRGPAEHDRRAQILDAANEYFRRYGYDKTTVADLAKAIGLSTAYIYKFFDSKQAIGEAVVRQVLGRVSEELRLIARGSKSPASRLRMIYETAAKRGSEVCFHERKIHDLAVIACGEKWQAVRDHRSALGEIIRELLAEGRKSGDFERKTPISEVGVAILQTLDLFTQPLMLEQYPDDVSTRAQSIANLVIRSLAP